MIPSMLRKNITIELRDINKRIKVINKELTVLIRTKNSIVSALKWLDTQEKRNDNIRKKNKSRRYK